MKAVRYYGIKDVRFEDIPIPKYEEDEVLIKVAYGGICGSDLHIYNKGFFVENVPSTMGHEFSGTVVETGSNVTRFKIGDKVVGNPMVPCGSCPSCQNGYYNTCDQLGFIGEVREGAFAEYIALPQSVLVKMDSDAPLRESALAEPLAVVLNLLERAHLTPDTKLAVIGAGPIGLLSAMAARDIAGLEEITIVNRSEGRRQIAAKAGISSVLEALPEGEFFDAIIETAGKKASLGSAISHTRAGGSIYVVSIFEDEFPTEINTIVARELTITGCNAYTQEHIAKALKHISAGDINVAPVITGEFSLEDGAKAFETISKPGPAQAKLLFKI